MNEADSHTDDTDRAVDEREVLHDEKHIPAWVVMEAVGRAIDEDVKGVESRSANTFAVLVKDGDSQ